MSKYIRYEIEERRFSSNIIVGVYLYKDENGKTKEKKDVIFCCCLPKAQGDYFIDDLLVMINEKLQTLELSNNHHDSTTIQGGRSGKQE